ncbi:MAG TPA: HEAT repeat domain-containing protein, partial [Vicinamibacteria bacterium]
MRTGLMTAVLVVLALAAPPARAQLLESAEEAQTQAQRDRDKAQRDREHAREVVERDREKAERDRDRNEERANREDERYERGTEALDEERWDRAIEAFEAVASMGGRRADAGLYWKAYAQRKAGRPADALATLGQLRKTAPQSKYLKEADNLELEIRQDSGQRPAPARESDEDLKLIALNALLTSNAEQAVPLLEKFLGSGASPKLRNRALFVLTQSGSPRGRAVVADIARGKSHPDLQRTAVKYLGLFGGDESRQLLSEIYASTDEVDVKKAVLQAYMTSGNKAGVLAAARGEKSPELRRAAIRQLGPMG